MSVQRRIKNRVREVRRPHVPSETNLAPFIQSRQWLSDRLQAARLEGKARPETLCNILLGCWICDSLTGSLDGSFSETIRDIGSVLTQQTRRPKLEWSKTPPTLSLIAAALFHYHQIHVDFLHANAGYVSQAQAFLANLPRSRAKDEVAFFDKWLLLHRMGRVPRPKPATLTDVVRFADFLPLTDIGASREHLLGLISSATEFGRRSVVLAAAKVRMEDQLLGFAMAALRKYELIAGCRWMRAAHFLGLGGHRLEACIEFLRLHQRPEGPFGYYDVAESSSVAKLPKSPSPFFIGTSINLPVTVECLWTLAETTTPWRLFSAIPMSVSR